MKFEAGYLYPINEVTMKEIEVNCKKKEDKGIWSMMDIFNQNINDYQEKLIGDDVVMDDNNFNNYFQGVTVDLDGKISDLDYGNYYLPKGKLFSDIKTIKSDADDKLPILLVFSDVVSKIDVPTPPPAGNEAGYIYVVGSNVGSPKIQTEGSNVDLSKVPTEVQTDVQTKEQTQVPPKVPTEDPTEEQTQVLTEGSTDVQTVKQEGGSDPAVSTFNLRDLTGDQSQLLEKIGAKIQSLELRLAEAEAEKQRRAAEEEAEKQRLAEEQQKRKEAGNEGSNISCCSAGVGSFNGGSDIPSGGLQIAGKKRRKRSTKCSRKKKASTCRRSRGCSYVKRSKRSRGHCKRSPKRRSKRRSGRRSPKRRSPRRR